LRRQRGEEACLHPRTPSLTTPNDGGDEDVCSWCGKVRVLPSADEYAEARRLADEYDIGTTRGGGGG
jgi:hypothetical protein